MFNVFTQAIEAMVTPFIFLWEFLLQLTLYGMSVESFLQLSLVDGVQFLCENLTIGHLLLAICVIRFTRIFMRNLICLCRQTERILALKFKDYLFQVKTCLPTRSVLASRISDAFSPEWK